MPDKLTSMNSNFYEEPLQQRWFYYIIIIKKALRCQNLVQLHLIFLERREQVHRDGVVGSATRESGRPCDTFFLSLLSLATVEKGGNKTRAAKERKKFSSPRMLLLVFGGVIPLCPLNTPLADRPFLVSSRRPYAKDCGCSSPCR